MSGIQGLGKGLDALIRETRGNAPVSGSQLLALKDIVPNPSQPRQVFSETALAELAASIKSQGLLQPILVRPDAGIEGRYQIVAGERRWRASKLAGLHEIPVVIKELSDREVLTVALIENLQREDLNPIEEALALCSLKEEYGLSQEALSEMLGKSRSSIANSLRLLALPDGLRADVSEGRLSAGHARALLSVTDARARDYLRNMLIEESLSVREVEGLAATWKITGRFETSALEKGGEKASSAQEEGRPAIREAGRQKAPESAKMLALQSSLCATLALPVRVTGKENRGRISISFSSRGELAAILSRLGLGEEDTPCRECPGDN